MSCINDIPKKQQCNEKFTKAWIVTKKKKTMKNKLQKELNKLLPKGFKVKEYDWNTLDPKESLYHGLYFDLRVYVEKQPRFKEGVWYYNEKAEAIALYPNGCGFYLSDNVWSIKSTFFNTPCLWKPADMSKVKELLMEKAKKDYPAGTEFKSMLSNQKYKSTYDFVYKDGSIFNSMGIIFAQGKWAEKVEPVFYIGDKPMYEGDEYFELAKNENWILKKQIISKEVSDYYVMSNDFLQFLTKEDALNYVLEEAKKRFEGNAYCKFPDNILNGMIESNEIELHNVLEYSSIYTNNRILWIEYIGWIAEPIKDQPLMLGNEVVRIVEPGTYFEKKGYYTESYVITCKGESVTKDEWMSFYTEFDHYLNCKVKCTKIVFKLGKFVIEYTKLNQLMIEPTCSNGISGITIEQIEAITQKLCDYE
jgi:hypothetical protein